MVDLKYLQDHIAMLDVVVMRPNADIKSYQKLIDTLLFIKSLNYNKTAERLTLLRMTEYSMSLILTAHHQIMASQDQSLIDLRDRVFDAQNAWVGHKEALVVRIIKPLLQKSDIISREYAERHANWACSARQYQKKNALSKLVAQGSEALHKLGLGGPVSSIADTLDSMQRLIEIPSVRRRGGFLRFFSWFTTSTTSNTYEALSGDLDTLTQMQKITESLEHDFELSLKALYKGQCAPEQESGPKAGLRGRPGRMYLD